MLEKKALICEDEALISHWLEKEVTALGYSVVGGTADGRRAVELAREINPDVILMDVKMPEMDGIEATRRIMEQNPTAIVMLTAYGDEKLVQDAIDAGASAYLVKPVSKQQLGPVLQMAIGRFEQFKQMEQQVSTLHEALEARKVVEKAKGMLMQRSGMSEEQAYAKLRKMSQDRAKPMKEIAAEVIKAAELFSVD
jgi:response regulator NasT